MTCPCCAPPTLWDKLHKMVGILRDIPGSQHGWDEVRAARDNYADVGEIAGDIVREFSEMLRTEWMDPQAKERIERLEEALADAMNTLNGIYHYTFEAGTTDCIRRESTEAANVIKRILEENNNA